MSKQVQCDKCRSTSIARSRPRGLEPLVINFTPYTPYRCMHCYHRFWHAGSLYRLKKILILAAFVLLAAVALYFIKAQFSGPEKSDSVAVQSAGNPVIVNLPTGKTSAVESQKTGSEYRPIDAPFNPEKDQSVRTEAIEESTQVLDSLSTQPDVAIQQLKDNTAEIVDENQVKQRALEKQIKDNLKEQEALYRVQISNLLKRWRDAWQAGDIQGYLGSYSSDFLSDKFATHEQWKENRMSRVTPEKRISLKLKNFSLNFGPDMNQAEVFFEQFYQSKGYADQTKKKIVLTRSGSAWKIIKEQELEQEGVVYD